MKIIFMFIVISLMFILAGCNLTPTPQPIPTMEEPTVIVPELNGTFWLLTSLNGDDPITNTYIHLMFIDGWATGNAGCNDYGGEYSTTIEGILNVHYIVSHQVSCLEPEGIMEQEALYLDILENVNQYGIVDGRLRLDAGDDAYLDFGYLQITD